MEKDTCIFVRNNHDVKTIRNLISQNKINLNSSLIVLWDSSMVPYFQDVEYTLLEEHSKKIDFSRNEKNILEFMKIFPHIKILDGKSLVELLEYHGYSLWWFIRQGFYLHCIRAVNQIITIQSSIKNKKISRILVLSDDKQFLAILNEAVKNLRVKVGIIKNCNAIKKDSYLKNKKELILDHFFRLIRVIQGFFRSLRIEAKAGKKNIVLFTQANLWTSVIGNIKGDRNSYTLLRDMSKGKKYNMLPIDIAINKDAAWKGIKEKKMPFLPFDYFVFKSFFDLGARKNLNLLRKRLKNLSISLNMSLAFKKALVYDDISLYHILKPKIDSYFLDEFGSFIGAARNFEAGKKLLRKYDINAVICLDENGTSRFLVFAAHACKVPSLGIQHGIIHPIHISYNYSKKDLCSYKTNLNCLLPDKTAVFGNYFKNILVRNGNYPSGKIAVTGQPRMDLFFEQKENYSKKELCKKLGLEGKKNLVVYASQPAGNESITAFSAIVKALKNLENAELIVKLHPAEDVPQYKIMLQELKYDAIVSKDIDLYEIIFCSDLVISIRSTVILEALAFGKEVIQLELMGKYETYGELAAKCINEVSSESELNSKIRLILSSKACFNKPDKKSKKFISEYYYRIDGKATKRVIDLVDSIAKIRK